MALFVSDSPETDVSDGYMQIFHPYAGNFITKNYPTSFTYGYVEPSAGASSNPADGNLNIEENLEDSELGEDIEEDSEDYEEILNDNELLHDEERAGKRTKGIKEEFQVGQEEIAVKVEPTVQFELKDQSRSRKS